MAWYNTGNIALTNGSATVTGSGTNFLVGAQIGEALYAPDGKLYEIQTINSATVITLASTYLGSTASTQGYQIIPTQSLVADLASDVTDLISDFANVRDYAGNGKFNDGAVGTPGITFTQDQDNGLYRIGSNNWALAAGGQQVVNLTTTAMNFPDNSKAIFGAGSDLQIYSDGTTGQVTGNVNFTGSVTATGTASLNSGNGSGTALQVGGESGGGIKTRYVFSGASQHNWQLGFATHLSQTFSITPSSAVGNTTFTTPALNINGSTGAATFAGSVTADGLTVEGGIVKVLHTGGVTSFADFEQFSGWDRRMRVTSAAAGIGIDVTNIDLSAGRNLILQQTGGSVGIGISSPDCQIHSSESTNNSGTTGLSNGGLQIENIEATSGSWSQLHLKASAKDAHLRLLNDGTLKIMTESATNAMSITETGNVGIGTSAPVRKLQIHTPSASGAFAAFTNTVTGATSSDGLILGYSSADYAMLWNYEATPILFGTSGAEAARIDASGDLILGSTASLGGATITTVSSGNAHNAMRNSAATAGKFWRQEVDSANIFYILNNATTGVYMNDGGTTWVGISDETVKENIVEIEGALDKVMDYRCVEYNLIADENKAKKIGFIAQDWEVDYSPVVVTGADGKLGMQYTETIPVLLKAIQEQQAIIEALTARIEALES